MLRERDVIATGHAKLIRGGQIVGNFYEEMEYPHNGPGAGQGLFRSLWQPQTRIHPFPLRKGGWYLEQGAF
jgi:hypothetical protein